MTGPLGLSEADLAVLGAVPLTPDDPAWIGRFRLLGLLGVGGMGRVYLGRADEQYVAVKVIRSELADDQKFRLRFARELEAVSRLDAACTAPLIDAEAAATRPWMATAFVPGVSLDDAAPLPGPAVLRLTAGIASALVGIHRAGLIHRDLKPSNVILALEGPKVIDFGVVHSADLSKLTMTGQHVGTPSYMAPEQAQTGSVSPAADIFALGGLITFAATGRPPFGAGNPAEVLYRVVSGEPDLSGLAAVDPELHRLAQRCLAKDPDARPDAAAVVAAVGGAEPAVQWPQALRARIEPRAILAGPTLPGVGGPTPAGETGIVDVVGLPPRRVVPQTRAARSRRPVLLAALGTALLVAIAAGLLWGPSAVRALASSNRSADPVAKTIVTSGGSPSVAPTSPQTSDPGQLVGAGNGNGGNGNGGNGNGNGGNGGANPRHSSEPSMSRSRSASAGQSTSAANTQTTKYSFEDGMDGWNNAGTSLTVSRASSVSKDGSYSLKIIDTAPGGNNLPYAEVSTGAGPVAGQTVTAWVYVDPGVSAMVGAKLFVNSANGGWYDGGPQAFITMAHGGWQKVTYTASGYGGAANRVGIQVLKSTASNVTLYLDDVTWG
jgi:eukaryotic-like serine/threonine-protein kinase